MAPTSSDNLTIKSSTPIEISRSYVLVVEFDMVKIATNSMGLKATKTLQKTSAENRSSLTKIASGRRVNSAADDAAGLAISRKIQATTKSLNAGLRNTASAISALDASLSGISELQQIIFRLKELSVQASNGIYTDRNRLLLDQEAKELINEYVRIAEFTKLNDKFLLDGSFNSDFMVGSSINESIDVEITGLLNKNPISLQNTATGSSEKILRSASSSSGTSASDYLQAASGQIIDNSKIAAGTSSFDLPPTVNGSVTSAFDYLDSVVATATSSFNTPASSTGNGTSSLSILPSNNGILTTTNFSSASGTATGTSTLNVVPNSTATISSTLNTHATDPATATSNISSGVPASSTGTVAGGGTSTFESLEFRNSDFSASDSTATGPLTGSVRSITGWDINLGQVSLDAGGANNTIGGYATPADAITPPGSTGDGVSVQSTIPGNPNPNVYSYTDSGNTLTLQTSAIKTSGFGIAHGPYIISQDAMGLNAGDEVSFDWEGIGGEQIDVFAYLLNVDDGSTVTLLDFTDTDGGAVAAQSISSGPLAASGRYKFVFISGSADIDGGGTVSSEVQIRNINITKNSLAPSITSSANVTIEAVESDAVSITRDKLASLDTIVTTPGVSPLNATPYVLSGADAGYFTVDQTTGDITSNPLRFTTKSSYDFSLTYQRSDGGFHRENITLNLVSSLGATSNLTAQEATSNVTINRSQLSLLDNYVGANPGGSFNLSGADSGLFTLLAGGNIQSAAGLDFDTRTPAIYNLTLEYINGADTFSNDIILELTDTLDSTATATAEEADEVKLRIADFTGSQTYATKPANAGGSFTLSGTDAGLFEFDVGGDIVSRNPLLVATKSTYNFNLNYSVPGGNTHVEAVTLNLTEALQANSQLFVNHGVIANINLALLDNISNFAASGPGNWRLESNATDPLDWTEFTIDPIAGTITSNSITNYGAEDRYDFDVVFQRTSDGVEFRQTVTLNVLNPATITTNIQAEETDNLTITLSQLPGSLDAKNTNPNGIFSLSGADTALFSIDSLTGEITSNGPMNLTGSRIYNFEDRYNFNVDYYVGGVVSRQEQVNLTITEALQSNSNLSAPESSSVSISRNQFEKLHEFAARDRYRGSYSIENGVNDFALFSTDPSGNVTSTGALEFNDRADHRYQFNLIYTASDGRIFRDYVELTLTDTFSSNASITIEEADTLTIPISELSSSANFKQRYSSGTFSLGGADASFFEVDSSTGEIRSRAGQQILRSIRDPFSLSLIFTADTGEIHTENININMTESLHSDDSISAQESQLIKVLIDDLLYLKAFALRDGNAGSYAITGADAALFQFDILGNVEAAGTLLFDDREDPVYRFNVEYTESLANGGQTFRAEISLRLTETYNSTANLSVVEGSNITIDIERLTGSNTYSKRHPGGTFSLTGTDAANFNIDPNTGAITSINDRLLRVDQLSHQFNILYTDDDGNIHAEAVTLNLNPIPSSTNARTTIQEAQQVQIELTDLTMLDDFVASKANSGVYRIAGEDADLFEITSTGKVVSKTTLDYDDREDHLYQFSVIFDASDSTSFSENIQLFLSDTLSASASITAEESENIFIERSILSATRDFSNRNKGGTLSLTGADADLFSIDKQNKRIISKDNQVTLSNKSSYDLTLNYTTKDGRTHRENINLNLVETTKNQSRTHLQVVEANQIKINKGSLVSLNQFAALDNYSGKFSVRRSYDSGEYLPFLIDQNGNIETDETRNFDYDKGQTKFSLIVEYIHSNGMEKYTDFLTLELVNDPDDDYDILMEQIDLDTQRNASNSVELVEGILKKLNSKQSALGALKNRFSHNLNYQLDKDLNLQTANGRIIDADMAFVINQITKTNMLENAASKILGLSSSHLKKQVSILLAL